MTHIKNKFGFLFTVVAAVMFICSVDSTAQDWSRWRGSNGDGIYREANLNLDWAQSKPSVSWTFRQAGAGYSTPVIVGNTLYCQGAADGSDFAFALDTQTGNLKWKQSLGPEFVMDRGHGPRGAVTVDGDRLYLIRGGGQIHCLSATDGRMIWQKDFRRDLGGNIMSRTDWGFSESPLVDGNLVICTPGGNQGTLVALDKNTGNVVWRSREWTDLGGYSSPIVAEIHGVRQYIQFTAGGVAGVSAADGKLLWKANIASNQTAVCSTPVYHDNIVYVSSGYNAGCGAVRIHREGNEFRAETLYTNRNISNHHGGVVQVNGNIYGFSDTPPAWVCQNMTTGEIVWSERQSGIGKGSIKGVNDRFILLDERNGTIAVIAASPNGWREFGRMEIPERSTHRSVDNAVWTHPVVANGKLYIRDHELLFCFDLK